MCSKKEMQDKAITEVERHLDGMVVRSMYRLYLHNNDGKADDLVGIFVITNDGSRFDSGNAFDVANDGSVRFAPKGFIRRVNGLDARRIARKFNAHYAIPEYIAV